MKSEVLAAEGIPDREKQKNRRLAAAAAAYAASETTALLSSSGNSNHQHLDADYLYSPDNATPRYDGASELAIISARDRAYSDINNEKKVCPKVKKHCRRRAGAGSLMLLLVVAGGAATTIVYCITTAALSARQQHSSMSSPLDATSTVPDTQKTTSIPLLGLSSSEQFVFAPNVVQSLTTNGTTTTTTITFQELAAAMVPTWYGQMIRQLNTVLTPSVQPSQVYTARKIILKTRDLLDVFSPAYPPSSSNNDTTTFTFDLWNRIRHFVSHLYMSLGEFQDLHNAHVRYTLAEMEEKRATVLHWNEAFAGFRQEHPEISTYLVAAPSHLRYRHKESHLFWRQGVVVDVDDDEEQLPSGSDPATPSLQKLGKKQLETASYYLRESLPLCQLCIIMNETAHAIYHNLRKELRSLTDEFDLFAWVMFPVSSPICGGCCCPWVDTVAAVRVLKRARKILGDINDDWTAFSFYVEKDEYPVEQERLKNRIEGGWSAFKLWVKQVDLEGVLQYLGEVMEVNTTNNVESPPSADRSLVNSTELDDAEERIVLPDAPSLRHHHQGSGLSLLQFLCDRKRQPTRQLVLGNEAGDADTIISALSLAYIESVQEQQPKTPIVAIPKADLDTQRPEVNLLLELAGISHPTKVLLFIDDALIIEGDAVGDQVTLVDHNVLAESLERENWTVVEIVDHHQDQGQYLDTCSGDARNIAFAGGRASVASACTLVAERLRQQWPPPCPASVGLLLLGVILLDSVNLSERVGKVTQRDMDAVADLLSHTDWDALPVKTRQALQMPPPSVHASPDPSLLFQVLQDAKYDFQFWTSLSVRDSLRLDYKEYPYDDETKLFGISTVLMPMDGFLSKQQLVPGIVQYMEEVRVDFLGIMFAFQDVHGRLHRQFAICGTENVPLDDISSFLLRSDHSQGSLDLDGVSEPNLQFRDGLRMRFFNQRNVKPSRKQIGPILLEFFESSDTRLGDAVGSLVA